MDDDYEDEDGHMGFAPQRWSWSVLLRAGLDFAGHVAEGAHCAITQLQNAVISHEVRVYEERAFADQLSYDLESLPETDEYGS